MSVEIAIAIVGISFVVITLMKMFFEWQQAEIEAVCWTAAGITAVLVLFIVWPSSPNVVPGSAYVFGSASAFAILAGLAVRRPYSLRGTAPTTHEEQY